MKSEENDIHLAAQGKGRRGSFQLNRTSPPPKGTDDVPTPPGSGVNGQRRGSFSLRRNSPPIILPLAANETTPLVKRLESTEWRSNLSRSEIASWFVETAIRGAPPLFRTAAVVLNKGVFAR
mmetsp:Transcript_10195/g.20905  ORF Transcript_10195/g.20905 Transcript_10195/m.20905 type:complete len:122 (+) Transcript_10195:93-458(+)